MASDKHTHRHAPTDQLREQLTSDRVNSELSTGIGHGCRDTDTRHTSDTGRTYLSQRFKPRCFDNPALCDTKPSTASGLV